ncbi:MAG: acetyl-CoA carboxylase biotin carboxyl carrier protein [Firmicutes bacterium]|nr:acetyl-CoA carboxylase biotin carboxyl carrier protein [Bacillota bacterium]
MNSRQDHLGLNAADIERYYLVVVGEYISVRQFWPVEGWLKVKLEDIQALVQIVQESDLVELIWEDDGSRLVLRKGAACGAAPAEAGNHSNAQLSAEDWASVGDYDEGEEARVTIEAPMVGTFYRAPAPDADPYVRVGDTVEIGQPLCIIEAMKLMNEIESEVRGRIIEVLVENAQPVEYGQPLFIIERL